MAHLVRAYERSIAGLAVLSGLLIAVVFLAILLDATVHAMGLQPPAMTATATEYALLYLTMLSAPWLLREKGHIVIDVVRYQVGARTRRVLELVVYAVGTLTCLTLAWYGLEITLSTWARGELDVRSYSMPRWVLYAPMPLGFFLLGVEFARLLFGRGSIYRETLSEQESL